MDPLISYEGDYITVNATLTAPMINLAGCSTYETEKCFVDAPPCSEDEVNSEDLIKHRVAPTSAGHSGGDHHLVAVCDTALEAVEALSTTSTAINFPTIINEHQADKQASTEDTTSLMHNYSTQPSNSARIDYFRCFQCKLNFVSEDRAVAHFKSVHSRITCHHCRLIQFYDYLSYMSHVKRSHIVCCLCEALIKHKTALQKHLSRYHPHRRGRLKVICGEPNCAAQFVKLVELTSHLKGHHHLPVVTKSATFSSWDAAQQWLLNEEFIHNVKFVVRNSYRCGESSLRKYWCHWNGQLQREPHKTDKSPQCTAFCVMDISSTRCIVQACLTHYGHHVDEMTARCSFGSCDQIGLINPHTNRSVRFFKAPSDKRACDEWSALLNVREMRDVLVCSRHFPAEVFDVDASSGLSVLRQCAVPTIFGHAAQLNDPFVDCQCFQSEQCAVARENMRLKSRLAVLEEELSRARSGLRVSHDQQEQFERRHENE